MNKTEFHDHPVWATLDGITKTVDDLYDGADAPERAQFDRIRQLVAFSIGVRPLGAHHADRFSAALLDNLNSSWSTTVSQMANRVNVNSPSYTEQAAAYAEQSLTALYGLWTPTTPASQQAQQQAVYESLVETAQGDAARLRQEGERLAARLEELRTTAEEDQAKTSEQLETVREAATQTRQIIDGFDEQIQEIVKSGTTRIADLATENTKSYMEWREQQAERFDEDFTPFTLKIQQHLDTAEETLETLRTTEKDYANLTAAAAANQLAHNFMEEAKTSRRTGLWLYGAGFFLLCLAAAPLALLLFGSPAHTNSDTSLWVTFSIRAAIGVLTASAATVAIRLGGRFIDNGQQSKRTELELRAFGPFLANVDKSDSDTARLEFVDRAFGTKPSVPDHAEEAIPVSTFSQILTAVTKLIGR